MDTFLVYISKKVSKFVPVKLKVWLVPLKSELRLDNSSEKSELDPDLVDPFQDLPVELSVELYL